MDPKKASDYVNPSQQVKHVTEDWAASHLYCLDCGRRELQHFPNRPFLDFECQECEEKYELKSKRGPFGGRVINSAYKKKIQAIEARQNPSFLFLQYELPSWRVVNLFALPGHVFHPQMIEARKPLGETARRAGWVGSTILLKKLPADSRVFVIRDGRVVPEAEVRERWDSLRPFRKVSPSLRGWALDLWSLVKDLDSEFTLSEAYGFEETLRELHPKNRHVREKIRQQLQCLRDAGLVQFKGKGRYAMRRKIVQTKLDTN